MSKRKSNSRPARWAAATSKAEAAVEDLKAALQDLDDLKWEYQEWLDNLPENLQSSGLSEKLNTICDLEFEGAADEVDNLIQEAVSADLPLGFGRD